MCFTYAWVTDTFIWYYFYFGPFSKGLSDLPGKSSHIRPTKTAQPHGDLVKIHCKAQTWMCAGSITSKTLILSTTLKTPPPSSSSSSLYWLYPGSLFSPAVPILFLAMTHVHSSITHDLRKTPAELPLSSTAGKLLPPKLSTNLSMFLVWGGKYF